MAERLVIRVKVNGVSKMAIHWRWGAYGSTEFYYKCRLLNLLDEDDDLETMLRKVAKEFEGSGLALSESWWRTSRGNVSSHYHDEIGIVDELHAKGIPEGNTADGIIAVTDSAMDFMESDSQWCAYLDLDEPNFCFLDSMWLCEDKSDYEDFEDEIVDAEDWMYEPVTKENAKQMCMRSVPIEGFFKAKDGNVYQLQ